MRWGTLFSGVGGVEWGLEAAGHTTLWAVEKDAIAAEYHRLNHPKTQCFHAAVNEVEITELANIDGLWASPPCQGHSRARRKDLPVRDDVWAGLDLLPYAAELQPRVVIIENVPQYRNHPVYKEVAAGLLNLGYIVDARILNAADYGVPQTRERLIVQARKDGRIAWPTPQRHRVGWYAAVADLIERLPVAHLACWQHARWQPEYNDLLPAFVDSQFAAARDPHHQARCLTIRQSHEPVPTITASHKRGQQLIVLADSTSKRLTPEAIARLQTMPDTAIWPARSTQAFRLIGNAVPSLLAQRLAESAEAGARYGKILLFPSAA